MAADVLCATEATVAMEKKLTRPRVCVILTRELEPVLADTGQEERNTLGRAASSSRG